MVNLFAKIMCGVSLVLRSVSLGGDGWLESFESKAFSLFFVLNILPALLLF